MAFATEKDMVETILESDYLKELTNKGTVKQEVKGLFGIPDIVAVISENDNEISLAYEAKLKNWKRALFQAFRYKAFVNLSFVVMDYDNIKPAVSNVDKFKRSNIGLISIDNKGKIRYHYKPSNETPYSPQLESKFNDIMFQ